MICPNCGNEVPKSAFMCPCCGTAAMSYSGNKKLKNINQDFAGSRKLEEMEPVGVTKLDYVDGALDIIDILTDLLH